jgi:hypothetical protein
MARNCFRLTAKPATAKRRYDEVRNGLLLRGIRRKPCGPAAVAVSPELALPRHLLRQTASPKPALSCMKTLPLPTHHGRCPRACLTISVGSASARLAGSPE